MSGRNLLSVAVSVFIVLYFGYRFGLLVKEVESFEPSQKNSFKIPSIKKLTFKKFSAEALARPSVWGLKETSVVPKKTVSEKKGFSFVVEEKEGAFYVSRADGSKSWKFCGIVIFPDKVAIFVGSDSKLYLVGKGEQIDAGLKVKSIGEDFVILDANGKSLKLSIFNLEEERR